LWNGNTAMSTKLKDYYAQNKDKIDEQVLKVKESVSSVTTSVKSSVLNLYQNWGTTAKQEPPKQESSKPRLSISQTSPPIPASTSTTTVTTTTTSTQVVPSNLSTQQVFGQEDVTRYDYQLQISLTEAGSEYISSIKSHVSYWQSKDTVHFVIGTILKQQLGN